jgi:DNA modification methylase
VFREVRRVLRDDGTLWLNLGDSYCSTDKWGGGGNGNSGKQTVAVDGSVPSWAVRERKRPIPGIKPKDLVGIPWRVAFALQADGWYLRQDIVWHKPNPMPESVTDRCTKSHEYMFLMAKSDRYYFDHEAIKEKSVTGDTRKPYGIDGAWAMDGRDKWEEGKGQQRPNADGTRRNKRSVWTVNTRSYREAHFATFPTKLIEPCIMAGTSEKGCCPTCGSPWERITERVGGSASVAGPKSQTKRDMGLVTAFSGYEDGSTSPSFTTVGWKPTCACQDAGDPVPCTVLEPFAGSGTTLFVSVALGRSAIGCELNPEYAKLIEKRLTRGVDKPEIDGSVARSEPVDTEPSSLEDLLGFDEEA